MAAALRELADYVEQGWLVRISGERSPSMRCINVVFTLEIPDRLLAHTDLKFTILPPKLKENDE